MSRHTCMRRLLVVVLVLTLCFSTMPTVFAETSADSGTSEENPYLTFTGSDSFTIHTLNDTANWNGTMEYSTDTETWQTWDGTEIASSEDGKLYIRGTGNTVVTGASTNYEVGPGWAFAADSSDSLAVTGNIEMILDYQTAVSGSHPKMGNHAFNLMFRGFGSALIEAPSLPATSLATSCYTSMFRDCTSLETAPELPATVIPDCSYQCMFEGCSSLREAPELPATSIRRYSYARMFYGCTSLREAPELPATELSLNCYVNMFGNCTNLIQAPELPATTLANSCYSSMFQGCTSLTVAPELPATTLANKCYSGMFLGCTNLNEVPSLPATTLAESCYQYMFSGCGNIKLSTLKDDIYQHAWSIPAESTEAESWNSNMFPNTGGTFTGDPEIGVVYYQASVPVTDISLNQSELTLVTSNGDNTADSTYQLTALISPSNATDPTINWTSSDESIATVDENGIVTAKTYGTAVITASSPDGASASCTVSSNFYDAAEGYTDGENEQISSAIAASINWMADTGITKGYEGKYFGSYKTTSRRDFVLFLWRFAGKPSGSGGKTFSDAKYNANTDSYKAIQWATSMGIINGYSDGTFRPNDPVTRAQVATMLWKYAGRPYAAATSSFPDVKVNRDGLTTNMVKAINWCSSAGLVKGYSSGANRGKFVPSGNCLRFQMSIILYRYNNKR